MAHLVHLHLWQRRFLAVPVFRPGNFGRGTFQLDIELVRATVSAFPCTLPEMRIRGVTAQANFRVA
jgi:hypothetical protein